MKSSIENLIDNKINQIKQNENVFQLGRVIKVQDYIIEVDGLENAGFFEKVVVKDKAEGYVYKIESNSVLVSLTKIISPIVLGDEVMATGKEFVAMYSFNSLGHIIDMFGEDKLMGKKFDDAIEVKIETPPIPIMKRGKVNRALLTGITGIVLMYPIGKGQRQLIIGDKKTGKTQIALDTIYNQKDKDVICIYVALGKTKKEVKEIYNQFLKKGSMQYTIILAAFNDELSPVLKCTPYVALSIAELYMNKGSDVLVVIDDLKRHADICREINLMTGNVPGRDAYPSDMFYMHSRLLEKGCQHIDGGSITILPICETKSGDITDFISTNIISITDGQIVLSSKYFEKGQKPAINYGLSVSRLGGAVQDKEVMKIGSRVRRELLSYLESRETFEMVNLDEINEELREKIENGKKILSNLNQYKFEVKTPEEMLEMFR